MINNQVSEYRNVVRPSVGVLLNRSENAAKYCFGWTARYKVWSIRQKRVLVDISIDLPESQVASVLRSPINERGQRRILLPVRLSSNLQRALVLQTLISILPAVQVEPSSEPPGAYFKDYNVQNLDETSCFLGAKRVDIRFSPDASYLAICVARTFRGRFIEGEIFIWHVDDEVNGLPTFQPQGKAISHNFMDSKYHTDRNFAFHPTMPLLVFGGKRKTFVWYLDDRSKLLAVALCP
jgi:hypothetical protein